MSVSPSLARLITSAPSPPMMMSLPSPSLMVSTPDSPCSLSLAALPTRVSLPPRSEEHTSELQSLMRNSYAVFCLNKTQPQPRRQRVKEHVNTYINTILHTQLSSTQ